MISEVIIGAFKIGAYIFIAFGGMELMFWNDERKERENEKE